MRSGLRVADAMTVRPVVTAPGTSVRDVAALMERYNVGTVLVKEHHDLLGIVSEADIVRRAILEGYDPGRTPASSIMTRDIVTVSPGADLFEAILLMRDAEVRTLPVVDGRRLVGFVTAKDILKLQPDLFEAWVEAFELREEERKLRRRAVIDD